MQNKTQTHEEMIESRRSWVRVYVTYGAAAFIFLGGLIVLAIGWSEKITDPKLTTIKDFYHSILPIATTIVTYWFATRKTSKDN